jgi:hypothetical protein
MGAIIPWTQDELDTLRSVYPKGGILAAMDALPNRSKQGIYKVCNRLDIRSRGPYVTGGNRLTPEPDPAIAGAFNQWRGSVPGQIFARAY